MKTPKQPLLALVLAASALSTAPLAAQVRITEYMYSGAGGEFVELTNLGATAVNLSGWSLDDDSALAGVVDLSPLGILASGQSAVVVEVPTATFEADWGLSGVPLLQKTAAGFGRNDAIVIFDAAGGLADVLIYGDQDFPGSIRTLDRSGHGCLDTLGTNNIFDWALAASGDVHASYVSAGGDVGSPGTYTSPSCVVSYDASLSEVRIAQPGADIDESFELSGSGSLVGLSYVILDGAGIVAQAIDLGAAAFSPMGYLVGAEATYSLGTPDLVTTLDFDDLGAFTHLLAADFSAAAGTDLDVNDDGVLDSTPWSNLVDALGFDGGLAGGNTYAPGVGPDAGATASLAILCPGGWRVGSADPTAGEDTPGMTNDCPPPTFDARLSEIRTDNDGTDINEYFELSGSGSLDGVWYVVLGDGGGDISGVVEAAIDLSGSGIGPSGLFVGAESTFDLGAADLVVDLPFENDDNVTHMLVRDFTGVLGQDLDVDDDGALDVTPWLTILDSVALIDDLDFTLGGFVYSNVQLGPVLLGAPAHVALCSGGPWQVGNADGTDVDSPGLANNCGGLGLRYCAANANSSGVPARMGASGSTSVAANDFTLECFDMPTVSPTTIFNYFVIGSATTFIPFAVNQGNLCVGGMIGRYRGPGQVTNAGMTGNAMVTIDLGILPPPLSGGIAGGETWYFQNFYRDLNPMATANLSDGLAVTFRP